MHVVFFIFLFFSCFVKDGMGFEHSGGKRLVNDSSPRFCVNVVFISPDGRIIAWGWIIRKLAKQDNVSCFDSSFGDGWKYLETSKHGHVVLANAEKSRG